MSRLMRHGSVSRLPLRLDTECPSLTVGFGQTRSGGTPASPRSADRVRNAGLFISTSESEVRLHSTGLLILSQRPPSRRRSPDPFASFLSARGRVNRLCPVVYGLLKAVYNVFFHPLGPGVSSEMAPGVVRSTPSTGFGWMYTPSRVSVLRPDPSLVLHLVSFTTSFSLHRSTVSTLRQRSKFFLFLNPRLTF
jgi:hypothetical protein